MNMFKRWYDVDPTVSLAVSLMRNANIMIQYKCADIIVKKSKDKKTKEVICYSVYKISKESWLETLKSYMKSVLPSIPDSDAQKKMAATITSLYEDTTTEVEKTESATLDEINAKLDAIENSTKTAVAPAPQSNDIEWLDVLETACNIIF